MKKIVDSNYLQHDGLREYLELSKENYIVLTDYVAMEAYKGDKTSSIFMSMRILSDYANQVIMLKGTQDICGIDPKQENLQNSLIDHEQTKGFAEFCLDLANAQRGDSLILQQIYKRRKAANLQMSRMLTSTEQFRKAILLIESLYSSEELKLLRTEEISTIPIALHKKILREISRLSAEMFDSHPQIDTLPKFKKLPNSFIFRNSICYYLLALNWISTGGIKYTKDKKLRNDTVDVYFATYATYFDGILSYDKKVNKLYRDTRWILDTYPS